MTKTKVRTQTDSGLFDLKSRFHLVAKRKKPFVMPEVVLLFIAAGSFIVQSWATTSELSQEAETGIRSGSSIKCADPEASAGQAVKFGSTSCETAPAVPPGQLIGWNQVYNGPGGAWHRLAKLADGTWLRVLTTFPSSQRSELQIYKSTDNARTWSQISGVNDGNRLVDNGFLYVAPNSDLLISARNNVLGRSYMISQWRSMDKGHTWSREADIDSASGNRGLWEPYYYSLGDGKSAVMWADETYSGLSQVLVQKVSSDNGRSWGPERVVVADGLNGRPGMAGVIRMTNGQYLFTFEVCGTQGCATYNKKSSNGIDWPSGIGTRIPGHVCGPFVMSLADGRVVVSSCRIADGNNTTPISYSTDFGNTWKSNAQAFGDAGEFGEWPALYQISATEIITVNGARIRFGSVANQ